MAAVFHLVLGIYVPDQMGVVISETIAVTAQGSEKITDFPLTLFVVQPRLGTREEFGAKSTT